MFLLNVPGATFIPGATSIPESRVRILETLDGLVSKSGKMLSTFEFWLELNTRCKG